MSFFRFSLILIFSFLMMASCQSSVEEGDDNLASTTSPATVGERCAPTQLSEVDEIIIGATMPLSPPGSVSAGEVMRTAFEIALAEINEQGGVLGKPVRLVIADTAGEPEQGTAVAEQLITEACAVAIVGEYHSAVGLMINEVANQYQIPVIFAETYSDDITATGYPGTFRIAPTSTFTAQMDARWLAEVGDYNNDGRVFAAVVAEDTSYGTGQIDRATQWFPEFGVEFSAVTVALESDSYADIGVEIAALEVKPDAIFIKVTGESAYLVQQALAESGFKPSADLIIVANQVALEHESYWENVPDGAFAVVPRIGSWPSVATVQGLAFAEAYQEVSDVQWPEAYAFEAYDSLKLMAYAIEAANSLAPNDIIAALEQADVELSGGRYYFPYGTENPAGGFVPDFMWHQWPDVPLLFLQYTEPNQQPEDMAVIWPEKLRTTDVPIVVPIE